MGDYLYVYCSTSLPLQRGLSLGQGGRPLLVPAAVVHRGAHFLKGGGMVWQHEASLDRRARGGTGRPGESGGKRLH